MVATTPATRKAKGRSFQQKVRRVLIHALGIGEADIRSNPMGAQGLDIWLANSAREKWPYGVECKHQNTISIRDWLRQTRCNCEAESAQGGTRLKPLLIFRIGPEPGMPLGNDYAVIELAELVTLQEAVNRGVE